jgi:hypothetical protein
MRVIVKPIAISMGKRKYSARARSGETGGTEAARCSFCQETLDFLNGVNRNFVPAE